MQLWTEGLRTLGLQTVIAALLLATVMGFTASTDPMVRGYTCVASERTTFAQAPTQLTCTIVTPTATHGWQAVVQDSGAPGSVMAFCIMATDGVSLSECAEPVIYDGGPAPL